jgi:hypothetical protein
MDVYMGYIGNENDLIVEDKYVTGNEPPIADVLWNPAGQDNIIAKNGGKKDSVFTFKFQRHLVTEDSRDKPIFKGPKNELFVAFSNSNDPKSKHALHRSIRNLDFLSPEIVQFEYIQIPIQYIVLVLMFAVVCVFGILSQFTYRIPVLEKITQGRLLPPIAHWIGDYVNEYFNMSLGELLVIICYLLLTATWVVITYFNARVENTNPFSIVAKIFGQLNLLNFGFVLFPIARHSIWNLIFGIPFDRALKYHRWVGFWAYVCLVFHFIFMGIFHRNSLWYLFSTNFTSGTQQFYKTQGFGFVFAGFASFVSITIMLAVTLFRRCFFNIFYTVHIIFSVTSILFAALHHYFTIIHMLLAILLYLVGKLFQKKSNNRFWN